jgi:RNA polymerase sigma-70 factor (ECF subfamily)
MSDPPSKARDADDDRLLRELDRAYQRGDPLEVRRLTGDLLGSYWQFIRNIARGRLRGVADPTHEAEDVAQEVMRKLAGALAKKRNFNKVFRRVVLDNIDYAFKDYWKSPARKDESEPQDISQLQLPKRAPEHLPTELDQARDVETLLSDLRPRDREVVLLRLYAGLSAAEVAQYLDISMSAVYGAMNRGADALRASPRTAHVRKRHERSAKQT